MNLSYQNRLDVFKSALVKGAKFSSPHEFPLLQSVQHKATKAIPFEKSLTASDHNQWVHFYTHDYQFERVWQNPDRYLPILKRFVGVITPDFSIYREMPFAMQVWNTYRNRAIAFWLQREGVPIIPNIRWGDERTYSFAFEGLPHGGTVAVSTNGTLRDKIDRFYFKNGLDIMIETLRPHTIINYSQTPEDIFGEYTRQGIEIIPIPYHARAMKKRVQ